MQKLMQQRYDSEPESMETYEKIQKLAAKIFLCTDREKKCERYATWDRRDYDDKLAELLEPGPWLEIAQSMITPFNVTPVIVKDPEVAALLEKHHTEDLLVSRREMAQEIFQHKMKYDLLCFQEADDIDQSLLPDTYDAVFTKERLGVGIAWNTTRFTLIENLGAIAERAVAVHLRDNENGKTVLVVSTHLRGCYPYYPVNGDSDAGDKELKFVLDFIKDINTDTIVIGMDSNVIATHPRLQQLLKHNFTVDVENSLEPTCTNPYSLLNTRIDWIAVKGDAHLINIPVLGVGLNSLETNISDHKPIAARVYVN